MGFQFSLRDSYMLLTLLTKSVFISFNSLCEILKLWFNFIFRFDELSILFARFGGERSRGETRRVEYFQFSLRDSASPSCWLGWTRPRLSILFARFNKKGGIFYVVAFRPFNSLCEIHEIPTRVDVRRMYEIFQFSLRDSLIMWNNPKSYLISSFNSLCEILGKLNRLVFAGVLLSILFARFWPSQCTCRRSPA